MLDPDSLPDDLEALKKLVLRQHSHLARRKTHIFILEEQLLLLRKQRFCQRCRRHRARLEDRCADRNRIGGLVAARSAPYHVDIHHPWHGITDTDMNKVGWTAAACALTCFVLPFAFVLAPALTLHGSVVENIFAVVTGFAGISAIAVGVVGCLTRYVAREHKEILEAAVAHDAEAASARLISHYERTGSFLAEKLSVLDH